MSASSPDYATISKVTARRNTSGANGGCHVRAGHGNRPSRAARRGRLIMRSANRGTARTNRATNIDTSNEGSSEGASRVSASPEGIRTLRKKLIRFALWRTANLSDSEGDYQMAARLTKKNELEDTPQVSPSQHKQAEGRFRLQVDRQTKATYATLEAAEAAGLAIKKRHPLVHVGVYDPLESVNKVIQLPEA